MKVQFFCCVVPEESDHGAQPAAPSHHEIEQHQAEGGGKEANGNCAIIKKSFITSLISLETVSSAHQFQIN